MAKKKDLKKKDVKKNEPREPDHHDAEILLTLYELRRDPELRKARDWVTQQFKPTSAAEVMGVLRSSGSEHNRWLRQFITYYEMAASLVHHGLLDRDLLEDSVTEYVNLYAKLRPFLTELRRETGLPTFMRQIERLVMKSLRGQDKLATMEKWFANRRSGQA
jgi:hypothetical protein